MKLNVGWIVVAAVVFVSCSSADRTATTTTEWRVSATGCEELLRRTSLITGSELRVKECREAGYDPVWNKWGLGVSTERYEEWRASSTPGATVRVTTSRAESAAERRCPGSDVDVAYTITGGTDLLITMMAPSGISQRQGARPGTTNYCMAADDFYSVSAQNMAPGSVALGCQIAVDGVTVARNSSSGEYVIVMCDAS